MEPRRLATTLHLICGLPGAGKTVLAKTIAASTDAFRFEPDEWIRSIWGDKAETEGTTVFGSFNHPLQKSSPPMMK
jgi:predicted kinase